MSVQPRFRLPFSFRPRKSPWRLFLFVCFGLVVIMIGVGVRLRLSGGASKDPYQNESSDVEDRRNENTVRLDGHVRAMVEQDRQALMAGYAADAVAVVKRQQGDEERFDNLSAIRKSWEDLFRSSFRKGGVATEEYRFNDSNQGVRTLRILFPNQSWTQVTLTVRFDATGSIVEEYLDIQESSAILEVDQQQPS